MSCLGSRAMFLVLCAAVVVFECFYIEGPPPGTGPVSYSRSSGAGQTVCAAPAACAHIRPVNRGLCAHMRPADRRGVPGYSPANNTLLNCVHPIARGVNWRTGLGPENQLMGRDAFTEGIRDEAMSCCKHVGSDHDWRAHRKPARACGSKLSSDPSHHGR